MGVTHFGIRAKLLCMP